LEAPVLLFLSSLALAQDDPVDDGDGIDITNTTKIQGSNEDGFQRDTTKITVSVDDDDVMHDFVADAARQAPPPDKWHLDLKGKLPLADNFDIQFDAWDAKYVVVELPVLVSLSRVQFAAEHPNGVVLVAEITSGTNKVVQTQQVPPSAVLDATPTLVYFKAALPNGAPAPDVRFLVKQGELPAPPPTDPKAKPAPPPEPPKDKFARTTVVRRPT
jgi:hypothetical protein